LLNVTARPPWSMVAFCVPEESGTVFAVDVKSRLLGKSAAAAGKHCDSIMLSASIELIGAPTSLFAFMKTPRETSPSENALGDSC
jgi:hypothetical protein